MCPISLHLCDKCYYSLIDTSFVIKNTVAIKIQKSASKIIIYIMQLVIRIDYNVC